MHDSHPIEHEELMAYLDGELSPERGAAAAAHLESCRECQDVAADLQSVSRRLMAWEVESSSTRIGAINPPLEASLKKAVGPMRRHSSWWWGIAAACVVVLVISILPRTMNQATGARQLAKRISAMQAPAQQSSSDFVKTKNPMIVHTAQLTLAAKDFDNARRGVEDILKQHKGYISQLRVIAPAGVGRALETTLRVPDDQLSATIAEIKRLGRVESESQGGEEVTSQSIDLDARLSNARNMELRLTDLLRQRTGKLADVMAVEVEIGRVRGEIERMEAEKKSLINRIDFATLGVTIREDYEALIEPGPFSMLARFRNATVEGYRSTVQSLIGAIALVLSYGPVVLLWVGILFFPVRFVWRRAHQNTFR